jgi:hypothetical protein
MKTEMGQECWICNQHIYTLVFWSEDVGDDPATVVDAMLEENVVEQIEVINGFKEKPIHRPVFFT